MDLKEQGSHFPHPWEIARIMVAKKYLRAEEKVLDIGCGDAFAMDKLKRDLNLQIIGVDSNYKGTRKDIYRELHEVSGDFDKILMMDVLEHVERSRDFFLQSTEKLRNGGLTFVTVPAFQFLFSEHDAFLQHYRRYSLRRLREDVQDINLKIEDCHYFFFGLFLIRTLQFLFNKIPSKQITTWKRPENSFLTKILSYLLYADFSICHFLSRLGIKLPGLSCLVTVRKVS